MGNFGEVAVAATKLVANGNAESPKDGWMQAARRKFPNSDSSRDKGCPKCAYFGLCEERLVRDIPSGNYTRSRDNKRYAIEAVEVLSSPWF